MIGAWLLEVLRGNRTVAVAIAAAGAGACFAAAWASC